MHSLRVIVCTGGLKMFPHPGPCTRGIGPQKPPSLGSSGGGEGGGGGGEGDGGGGDGDGGGGDGGGGDGGGAWHSTTTYTS